MKVGDRIEFNHHNGDFKWFRLFGKFLKDYKNYILVEEESKKYGELRVERALIIEKHAYRPKKKNNEEEEFDDL